MEGQGKYVYHCGNVYIGGFKNNTRHGKGKIWFKANGDTYEGDWVLDKMTGKGRFEFRADQKVYQGDYVQGAPYGYGTLNSPNYNYKG
jgi:hypothetical protein